MAYYDTTWYCNSVGYAAVPVWTATTAIAAGILRRQTAPAVSSERVFICIVAGTTGATEPAWAIGRGARTLSDGTVTWQECTGASAVNGDIANTANWTTAKATGVPSLGAIIKRNNGASYQICTLAGAMGASEPAFSDVAGTTTSEGTQWTSLGPVGNFTGGQAPFARLASTLATNWFASGNTIYVGNNHAETQSTAITFTASSALLAKILCHNLGNYPPTASNLTTGATITASGNTSISFQLQGPFYFYGLTFLNATGGSASGNMYQLGASAVGQVQNWHYFDNCSIQLNGSSGATCFVTVGNGTANTWNYVIFNNTTLRFAATNQVIVTQCVKFVWQNTGQILKAGSSVPAVLFQTAATGGLLSDITLEALDLSQLTNLYTNIPGSSLGSLTIKDCNLNAAATVTTPINTGQVVQMVRSDSAATAYKSTRYAYEATETTETSITRAGGAADAAGQAQSRKIVTTANAQWLKPFQAEPYAIYNATTGANVTVTVYGTINSASLPNNDEIFMEVAYLASSHPGIIVTTTKASLLANNAAVASDSSTWNGGGSGAGWSPFKLAVTVTPGMAGVIEARIRAAKASTTYYIDPQIVLT